MDDLLKILWLPVDVYAQWWAGMFAIAALVALIVAWVVYKAAAGKAPAAVQNVDLTQP